MPPEILGRGVQRIPEEVLLAAGRSRANNLCKTRMRLGEVISQAGTTRMLREGQKRRQREDESLYKFLDDYICLEGVVNRTSQIAE